VPDLDADDLFLIEKYGRSLVVIAVELGPGRES
jgi:hypothetical protein